MVETRASERIDVSKLERVIGGSELLLGYPSGIRHPKSDLDNSELAAMLHDGTSSIPARPWLLQALRAHMPEIKKEIEQAFRTLIRTGQTGARRIGVRCVGFIQSFVRGGYYREFVPNAESTIRRKSRRKGRRVLNSDVPLIDTGFMINQTTYLLKGKR